VSSEPADLSARGRERAAKLPSGSGDFDELAPGREQMARGLESRPVTDASGGDALVHLSGERFVEDIVSRGRAAQDLEPITVEGAQGDRRADTAWNAEVVSMTLRFEIFPSDLDATADFYGRVVGFSIVAGRRADSPPYLSMQRDEIRVGASRRDDAQGPTHRRPPTGVEIVLEVDDVTAELHRAQTAGWPITEPVQLRPWGLRDFRVLDPSGYYLRISDRRQPSDADAP
jgi:predicted enzyme related to lactoylglutathione lyase